MRQYVISLKRGVDHDQFWQEMESRTRRLPFIPDRAVDIVDNYDDFTRLCSYHLTPKEADTLKQDPRVAGVDIPFAEKEGVEVGPFITQTNDFTKPLSSDSGNVNQSLVNWGLIRSANPINVYGTQTTTNLSYQYAADGAGIDLVISDSGIQGNHPEFQYVGNTTSRVQPINWAQYEPALSTMPNPLEDPNGHGTHVAGIAGGKTYGWAKAANIYSIVAYGPGAPTAKNQFAAIKKWHVAKNTVGNAAYTGRPTVVNMSWGTTYRWWFLAGLPSTTRATYENLQLATTRILSRITQIRWQNNIVPPVNVTSRGILLDPNNPDCINSLLNGIPYRDVETDGALGELIDSGIVVVRAAGNSSYKIDKPVGGTNDFTNYFLLSGPGGPSGSVFYNQGLSPQDDDDKDIEVGNLDSVVFSATQDQKGIPSNTGPGVDIYAAGTRILSASTSNVNATLYSASSAYFLNNGFRQLNINGTSMASPQIAGMACIYLQAQPFANNLSATNCTTIKSWLTTNATSTMYSPGTATSYTNFRSTLGGPAKVAYQNIQGLSQIKTGVQTWKPVKSVSVKNDSGTWTEVKNIWVKDGDQWKPSYTDPS